MGLSELCNRSVVVTPAKTSVEEASRLMREQHVGSLVVAEETARGHRPVGIVTDRDIVIEVVAAGVDPTTVTVGEIMAPELVTAREVDEPWDTIRVMRERGVRRMPVVGDDGLLVGIVTVDDLLEIIAEQLDGLAKAISAEQTREARSRS
jgi:CBS domain-containing protein